MKDLKNDLAKHTPILKNAEKLGLLDQQVHMFSSTDPTHPLQVSIMLKQNQDESWTLSIKEKQEYLFVFKKNNVIHYVNKTDPYTSRVYGAGAPKNPSAGACTGIANLLLSAYVDRLENKTFIATTLNPTPAPEKTAVSTAPAALFSIVVTPPPITKPVTHPTDSKTITTKP